MDARVRGVVQGRRSAYDWAASVREWRGSGQSAGAFCGARGLSLKTFKWWRWALRVGRARVSAGSRRGRAVDSLALPAATTGARASAPAFVEVVREPAGPLRSDHQEEAAAVELVLRHGRRVRVHKDFDGATLRRVVAILEEA